ncbi:SusC/RagA family TonB-linked outer membrane protein [Halalkalibaculum sp. DA3122]|uniref:SusC/RagA family TonB-linked outer membrane protein n=1 Tax=unclassified Halalkalibaculum TaxID=2964617 RepID=UPI0037552C42
MFSFIGYQTREVPINGRTQIDAVLTPQALVGEDVVVVGYGTQRSEEVITSTSTISMEDVEDLPVSGVDQSLSGQMAGVRVRTSNGIPGGGPQIKIRGIAAVGAGSDPLYVVDGFPLPTSSDQISNPINDIAPQDIESITVLKDASATAIYGSRGANGVVLITTKKGRSGDYRVQISAKTGLQRIPEREMPDLMNAEEFARFKKESIIDQIRVQENREATDADIPELYQNPEELGEGTDWFDVISRVGQTHDLNFSLSGGNENVRSYVSAGYFNQEGVIKTSGYQRFSVRANVDADLTSNIRAGVNIAPTFSFRESSVTGGIGRGGGGFGDALVASPIPPVYNEDGSYNAMIDGPAGIFPYPNPLMSLTEIDEESRNTRILFNIFGEYEIVDNLVLKSTFNTDWEDSQREYFRPSTVGALFTYPPTIPEADYDRGSYLNWVNENTLSYQNTFGDGHNVSGLLGFSIQKNINESASFDGDEFPDDDVQTFNAAARITGATSESEWSLISYLARANYNYKDRYLLTATVRRDGSSRFGSNNRWGIFPSAAIGWHLSNESFMGDVDWVSDLKLRASYGQAGNFKIGNYTYMSQIESNDYILGGSLAGGRTMESLGNPNLGWEKTSEFNLGLDIGVFDDRLYLITEFYKKNTQDLLLNVEIPQSSGFSNLFVNRGEIENVGMEFDLTSRNIVSSGFSWSTSLNLSTNKNEVLALGRGDEPILSGSSYEGNPTHITMVGQPIGMFYGYVHDGIYQNQQQVDSQPSFPGAIPGNMRVKDINGDGVINPIEDFTIVGNPYPDFTWGMTNNLTYKNFDFKVLLTGSVGGERMVANRFTTYLLDGLFNVSRDLLDRWRSPENPGNNYVPTTAGSARGRRMFRDSGSQLVEKNDYVWVKNITLGYTLPSTLLDKMAAQRARLYISVQNPLLFTDYAGRNPEVTNYGNQAGGGALVPGFDSNPYPTPMIFTTGINLTF